MALLKQTNGGAAKKGNSKKPFYQRDSRITKNGSRSERDAAPRVCPVPVSADGATRRLVAPPCESVANASCKEEIILINSNTDASSTDSDGFCVLVEPESTICLFAKARGLVLKKLSGRVNSTLTSHTQPALKAMLDKITRIRHWILKRH